MNGDERITSLSEIVIISPIISRPIIVFLVFMRFMLYTVCYFVKRCVCQCLIKNYLIE